ncbi:MAG: translation initiation factor IF-2 subunit beta [Nanoarchaeota archaeon]|nr:translation initiation factor IF-2 subunit beta [Nanoarchaeota archaeon]
MAEYSELLKKAKNELPQGLKIGKRFEMPKVKGHIQGHKTVITNFMIICGKLARKPEHILKYLQRELATPAKIEGARLVLGRKIGSSLINTKLNKYADEFVLCYDCKKPDTKLVKEGNIIILKCMACGAKNPVKTKL